MQDQDRAVFQGQDCSESASTAFSETARLHAECYQGTARFILLPAPSARLCICRQSGKDTKSISKYTGRSFLFGDIWQHLLITWWLPARIRSLLCAVPTRYKSDIVVAERVDCRGGDIFATFTKSLRKSPRSNSSTWLFTQSKRILERVCTHYWSMFEIASSTFPLCRLPAPPTRRGGVTR